MNNDLRWDLYRVPPGEEIFDPLGEYTVPLGAVLVPLRENTLPLGVLGRVFTDFGVVQTL